LVPIVRGVVADSGLAARLSVTVKFATSGLVCAAARAQQQSTSAATRARRVAARPPPGRREAAMASEGGEERAATPRGVFCVENCGCG
jgi:hypothetical protein